MGATGVRPFPATVGKASAAKAIALGGFIAGTLDIVAAIASTVSTGSSPIRMLQGIASGLMGRSSFHGGAATAALGLACHFVIAFGAAAMYYAVSRVMPVLVRRAVICGLLYGIPVYLVTNFVIVPLSAIGRTLPQTVPGVIIGLLVLSVGVGLPIGLATKRYSN